MDYSVRILRIGGGLLISCDNEQEFCSSKSNLDQSGQYVQLSTFNQLQSLNDSLVMTKITTRGWWGNFKKACIIAGADIAGFGFGAGSVGVVGLMIGAATGGSGAVICMGIAGTICAVGASSEAFDLCWSTVAPPQDGGTGNSDGSITAEQMIEIAVLSAEEMALLDGKKEPSLISRVSQSGEDDSSAEIVAINFPEQYQYLNDLGVLHNVMLAKIEDIRAGLVELPHAINDDTNPELLKIIRSDEFYAAYNAILHATVVAQTDAGGLDMDKYCAVDGIVMSKDVAKVFELFLDVYQKYPDTIVDAKILIEEYVRIIEASDEFTEDEKISIYSGLAVAAQSPLFWQERL